MRELWLSMQLCIISVSMLTTMTKAQTPAAKANQIANAADIIWSTAETDGVLVGLRMNPVAAAQPLVVQFLVKNNSNVRKVIACSPTIAMDFDVRPGNQLFPRAFVRAQASSELSLSAGEIAEPKEFQLTIATQQLLPGIYTIPSIIGVWQRYPNETVDYPRSLGELKNIPFTVGDLDTAIPLTPPEESDVIAWGDPLLGIHLGAKLVRAEADGTWIDKSQRFHFNESLRLQLFLHNGRDSDVEIEIEPPRIGDIWEVEVFNADQQRKLLKQMSRGTFEFRRSGRVHLKAGESRAVTGVPIQTFSTQAEHPKLPRNATDEFDHAGVEIVSVGERKIQNPLPLLEADYGHYFATATIHAKVAGTDFSAAITSGPVPFRVVTNPLEPNIAKPH